MKKETVNRKATELLENGKITARIDELKQKATEKIKYTVEDSFRKLSEIQRWRMKIKSCRMRLRLKNLRESSRGFMLRRGKATLRLGEVSTLCLQLSLTGRSLP